MVVFGLFNISFNTNQSEGYNIAEISDGVLPFKSCQSANRFVIKIIPCFSKIFMSERGGALVTGFNIDNFIPDGPSLDRLGNVERIMISKENIKKATDIYKSPNLGITMCQASYYMMGEDVYSTIEEFSEKIFFVHFRNAVGTKTNFHETFHDNGAIDTKRAIELYKKYTPNVPIRVDHVPLMAGESQKTVGYAVLGRLFAIGYLKGLME